MAPPNPASLSPFKAWILLLFHGKDQGSKHSPSQIADLLVRARCETSATEVRQALQMWGELREGKEEKILGPEKHSLLSPPPEQSSERPSVSHTPVDRPHGTSPFLHDGLQSYIELFGLPEGQPYPSHLPSAQEKQPRSQMMERFIGSRDDLYMLLDTREQRRRAALETATLEVDSTHCDINILEVDDDLTVGPADTAVARDLRNSPFFAGLRKGEGRRFLCQDVKQHRSRVSTGQRKSRSRETTTRTSQPSRSLETPPTEDLFGPDEFIEADDCVPAPDDSACDTQLALSHESNQTTVKRKRSFAEESDGGILEEKEQERNKRNRDGNMAFWRIRLMREQGRS